MAAPAEPAAGAGVDRLDAASLSTASLHEAAGRTGALPAAIQPLHASMRLHGPAFTVRCAPGDNLRIHHALAAAAPGDVLVVDTGSGVEFGYWGEVMATAALARGLAGLVITGGVRDGERLIELALPTFAACRCIRGTIKDPAAPGSVGEPIRIGDVGIARGDLVVGDADGVVVLEARAAEAAVRGARARDAAEVRILDDLRRGATTLDIYDLPRPETPA